MSALRTKMTEDIKTAMKAKDTFTLSTLRLVMGDIQTAEKSGKTPKEFDDQMIESFLTKQVKTRRDSATIYANAGEPDRADRENKEADLLGTYLPTPMTEDEVVAIIESAVAGLEDPNPKLMGQVMKTVNAEVKGRFDGKRISELVRARLV